MVDLQGQYKKIRWQVNREIKKVLKSAAYIRSNLTQRPGLVEGPTSLPDALAPHVLERVGAFLPLS